MTTSPTDDLKISLLGNVESASLILKGNAHEKLGDLPSAVECYKQALSKDVYCVEALQRLSEHHTLKAEDEKALVESMPLKVQCSPSEAEMVQFLYLRQLCHSREATLPSPKLADLQPLTSSVDVICSVANSHLKHLNLDACYQLTSSILERDPYHSHTLLLHVACCVQMNKFEVLFSLGHTLVNSAPNSALSWYVVGCYYMTINKHQNARKYFTKAVTLDPNFGHAHIAFGLSFAAEGEHDQAISAFSSAARIMRGSHLPLLYLGKEYHLNGVVPTSTRFMKSAFDLCPRDPCLLQEIGFIVAGMGAYPKAERYFRQAIAQLQEVDAHFTLPAWEPVYNNFGHVLRKQGKLDEALKAHHNALQLQPSNCSTLTAIAFVHLLREDYVKTVEYAHESLKVKREDQFTLEVLHTAMAEMSELPFVAATPDLTSLRVSEQESGIKMILRPVQDSNTRAVQDSNTRPVQDSNADTESDMCTD